MKIAIISPFSPYRGGIASFGNSLQDALLKANHDVLDVNYSRMYPQFLFPGKTQFLKDEKNINQVLDSMNPFNWLKIARRLNEMNLDLVIIQYWTPLLAPCLGFIARRLKAKVVFICHNVIPHEEFFLWKVLSRYVFNSSNQFICLSGYTVSQLTKFVENGYIYTVYHPMIDYGEEMDKNEARSKLGILNDRVILFFGLVRDYKGLYEFLDYMPEIVQNTRARLLVAGEFYDDEKKYRKKVHELGVEGFVYFHNWFIKNENIPKYFSAADIVILPYKTATQSGIIPMAHWFGRPVMATPVGGLPEYVEWDNGYVSYLDMFGHWLGDFYEGEKRFHFEHRTWDTMVTKIEEIGTA